MSSRILPIPPSIAEYLLVINRLLELSESIRYVAVYRDGKLLTESKPGTAEASSNETDRYEELLVNPILLKLAQQRGDIDCGGLEYFLIRYGSFFQLVIPRPSGHVSVCIEKSADSIAVARLVIGYLEETEGEKT